MLFILNGNEYLQRKTHTRKPISSGRSLYPYQSPVRYYIIKKSKLIYLGFTREPVHAVVQKWHPPEPNKSSDRALL